MREIVSGVWRWTWFSEEKGMNFNGYLARLGKELVLIDPAYAEEPLWAEMERYGKPSAILLTNKDHERASEELKRRFKAKVYVHEQEAPLLSSKPEATFKDGATLFGELKAIRFTKFKSPAECAFHWPKRKVLFVGDAVTGHPAGKVGLVKKHLDKPEVLEDLKQLLDLEFDALLVGDGEPFLARGKAALEAFLGAGKK